MKSALVMSILYALYYFVFRKETFHKLNRIILISILIVSSVFPLINFDAKKPVGNFQFYKVQVIDNVITDFAEHISIPTVQKTTVKAKEINWQYYMVIIYLLVIVSLLIQSGKDLFKMFWFRKTHRTNRDGKYKIVNTPGIITAFSFFNLIFIDTDSLEKNEINTIIEHEKVHSKLLHTLDLILVEIYILFFWFNPFIYLIRLALKEVHEYQADDIITSSSIDDKIEYQKLLIKKVPLKTSLCFTSNFNSLTLKRIKMMTKSKSHRRKLYNLVLIPIVILVLIFTLSSNKRIKDNTITNFQKDTCIVLDTTGGIKYDIKSASINLININSGKIISKPVLIISNDEIEYTADSMVVINGVRYLYGDVTIRDISNKDSLKVMNEINEARIRNIPFSYPVDNDLIVEGYYSISINPNKISEKISYSQGEVIKTIDSTIVIATAAGIIERADDNMDFGNKEGGYTIVINHENGYTTSYKGLSNVYVKSGEKVKSGEEIGMVGSTKLTPEPHVFYTIKKDDKLLSIKKYFPEY